ncbi:hypothetical protein [Luteimonas deserti]|uniref:DUF11 domain-containing protein n=1 Tax=Luteimonas deserti TaxID=2752306 RepID=A0A7Z0QQL7_9GAMM|nr:hypothetical protein [Luteimonas deserti]NYZ62399.1 hypothetical protein [Luteimonas deserti]
MTDHPCLSRRRTLLTAATVAVLGLASAGASAQVGVAAVQRSFINLSFEQPNLQTEGCRVYIDQQYVPGWTTTHGAFGQQNVGDCVTPPGFVAGQPAPIIELWRTPRTNSGLTVIARSGAQIAELNAEQLSRISQNVCLVPGDNVRWRFSHKGRASPTTQDQMQFLLDTTPIVQVGTTNTGDGGVATTFVGTAGSNAGPNGWRDYTGEFAYSGGGGVTNIGFEALSGAATTGNFLDDIQVLLKPFIELAGTGFQTVEGQGVGAPSLRIVGTLDADLAILVTVTGGTAQIGDDYTTPSGTAAFDVVIPAGTYDGDVLVPLGLVSVGNATIDGTRTVEIALTPSPDDFLLSSTESCGGSGIAAATWTLLDDDLDLAIEKSASVTDASPGDTVTFNLRISHLDGVAADGAVVRDPAVVGLDCSAAVPTCSATSGAVCPASPTIGALQGSGLVIPTLPAGGTLDIGFSCVVTAVP